jgi:hypothetical protein
MRTSKIIPGFVIQTFDAATRCWLEQEFIAADDQQVSFEDPDGEPRGHLKALQPATPLPLEMLQPVPRQMLLGDVLITTDGAGGANIDASGLKDDCPHCGNAYCYQSCDAWETAFDAQETTFDAQETYEDCDAAASRRAYNNAMDGIESFLLALAAAGVNVTGAQWETALTTATEACANNL